MVQDSHHVPPRRLEGFISGLVSSNVPCQLRRPAGRIGPGRACMVGGAEPEATLHECSNLDAPVDHGRGTAQRGQAASPDPVAEASRVSPGGSYMQPLVTRMQLHPAQNVADELPRHRHAHRGTEHVLRYKVHYRKSCRHGLLSDHPPFCN